MRWLFLLLLTLNIGYVAWELNRERPQRAPAASLPKGVERIVLLSELTDTTVQQTQADMEEAITPVEPVVTGQADDSTTAAKTSAAAMVDEADTIDTDVRTQAATSPATAAAGPSSPVETEPAADMCYTLGPFSEMKTLRLVTREIKDYVVEASFRSKDEQEPTMYRVYLTPLGSKQEAKALIKELVSNNIRDYFIISEGPLKNGISLGYFSNKGRAYRYADRVRKLGFDATAEPVFRSYTIYWLDYRIEAGRTIPRQIFDDYLQDGAQRLSRVCE